MPVMCMPWHVEHVRLAGLPSPTVLMCIAHESRTCGRRTRRPRATDSRNAFLASVAASPVLGSDFQLSPIGNTNLVVLFPSVPVLPLASMAGPSAGGPPGSTRLPAARCAALRGIHLTLELDDPIERSAWRTSIRDVAAADTACAQRRLPCICHHVHADERTGLRIARAGWPFLTMNGETPNAAAVTHFRLAAMRGRRYRRSWGCCWPDRTVDRGCSRSGRVRPL